MIKNKSILSASNLSVGYRSKQAETTIVSDISISFNKGELIGVIGVNGSGKSTLLRTLSGLQPPLKGDIYLDNTALQHKNPKEIAKAISLVLTDQPISKNLTVKELIALGRQPYTNWIGKLSNEDKAAIKKAMQLVGIEELADKFCYELSDGQLQNVLIARALAQDTKLIILDEPTSHLDMYHKAYVLQLLSKLAKTTGTCIVFATHEINLALPLCDKLLLVKDGKVSFETPEYHITNKHLNTLFPEDLISFNETSKQFIINSN